MWLSFSKNLLKWNNTGYDFFKKLDSSIEKKCEKRLVILRNLMRLEMIIPKGIKQRKILVKGRILEYLFLISFWENYF